MGTAKPKPRAKKNNSERRNFITIGSVGVCDPDGKRAAFTIGYSGKRIVAPVDLPVTMFVMAVIERAGETLGWSDVAAAKNDFSKAIKYLKAQMDGFEAKPA